MKMEGGEPFDSKQALNQVMEDLTIRREEQLKHRSSELEVQAAELKHGVDELGKQDWLKDLCSILKETGEVVVCSKPFENGGYPEKINCFFVATGSGIRIGFRQIGSPPYTNPHDYTWPQTPPGEIYLSKQHIKIYNGRYSEAEEGTLSIRHRAPSSLCGLRKFDYRYAAREGVTAEDVETHLAKAIQKLDKRYA